VYDPVAKPLSKDRAFWVGWAVLLVLTAFYTVAVIYAWAGTPLMLHPQGEAAAWLAGGESLFNGTAPREPFFRAPGYLAILAMLREGGVMPPNLGIAAVLLNALAHVVSAGLIAGLARKMWGRARVGLLAGALFGFYPPTVFLAAQPGPDTLALCAWLAGLTMALSTVWRSPRLIGGRLSRRHAWAYPATAGVSFALAASLAAPLWPCALVWPLAAIFLDRWARGVRMVAAALGVAAVIGGILSLQNIWGGTPQPLAGADLYHLASATNILSPWTAPTAAFELREDQAGPDVLATEAGFAYEFQTGQRVPGNAVLAGYWWRRAVANVTVWPGHSILRAARKLYQFFGRANYGDGPDFARAREDLWLLRFNPLEWAVLLTLGVGGLALGWRAPGARVAAALAVFSAVGALVWFPTMESRAPVVAVLAVLAGALVAQPWPRGWRRWGLLGLMLAAAAFAWLPRPGDPGQELALRDSRRRAWAFAAMGRYDQALDELTRHNLADEANPLDRELAAGWRFSQLLSRMPALPPQSQLEAQLLDNADLSKQSHAAEFRSGVYLWLLGRDGGALFFWRDLAGGDDKWAAAARSAIAVSGQETPDDAAQRTAWEMGKGPRPDPELAPFYTWLSDRAPK
jgi:hypothetical protein